MMETLWRNPLRHAAGYHHHPISSHAIVIILNFSLNLTSLTSLTPS
jgi:hypothetical protein